MDVVTEYCGGVESVILDRYWDCIPSFPRRAREAGEDSPPHLPQLDVPLRTVVRGDRMQFLGAGARVELFQSEVQRG